MNRVWIVEMYDTLLGRWLPTTGASLNRDDGRHDLQRWREDNPDDRYRLRCYVEARKGVARDTK